MKTYIVTIRLANGKNEYFECYAISDFDAHQQAGWVYMREGVVTLVEVV